MPFFLFPCLMEQAAHQEKSHAALSSVLWSAFLTVIKLWAGIVTGSLGIISEALHSGLDLMAAAMTFYAVKTLMSMFVFLGRKSIRNLMPFAWQICSSKGRM